MNNTQSNDLQSFGLKIGKKTFISTVIVLLCVMVFSFILTQIVPMGTYERVMEGGREVIVAGSYTPTEGARLPVWRAFTAPGEVFLGADALTGGMIIIFIILIGGVFLILDKCGLLKYALGIVIRRFGNNKYRLLATITLFSMALGSCMGLFEETIILAPITVALAVTLGWDALVGVGMSVLAVGFGFSASTFNPFTTGVSQQLAGLPLFSGLWLRAIVFAAVYLLLVKFLTGYAKRIENDPSASLHRGIEGPPASIAGDKAAAIAGDVSSTGDKAAPTGDKAVAIAGDKAAAIAGDVSPTGDAATAGTAAITEDDTPTGDATTAGNDAAITGDKASLARDDAFITDDASPTGDNAAPIDRKKSKKASIFFGASLLAVIAYVAAGLFIPGLSGYTMPAMAILVTIGGIGAGLLSGKPGIMKDFGKGLVTFLPAVVLIILAMSAKQIIVSGGIMDTLLQYAYNAVIRSSPLMSLIIIYLFVLIFNFFIPGAAAKAFLVIPLLAPLAELIGLTRQGIVLAFTFGDGFSNMVYPTNPVLLITLGIVGIPFTAWFRWTWKLQAVLIAICIGFLILAYTVGYGPY